MISKELIDIQSGEAGGVSVEILHYAPTNSISTVLMVPSLGRPGEDFEELARYLYERKYQILIVQPPGHGASTYPKSFVSLNEMARYCECVRAALAVHKEIHCLGHAFGNRLIRCYASDFSDNIKSVILIACGGIIAPLANVHDKLLKCFEQLPKKELVANIKAIFFAKGNNVTQHWSEHWNGLTALYQGEALKRTDVLDWWTAGNAPILTIQPAQDVIAVKANALALVDSVGDRCKIYELANAGHAALPEQPAVINKVVENWLREGWLSIQRGY